MKICPKCLHYYIFLAPIQNVSFTGQMQMGIRRWESVNAYEKVPLTLSVSSIYTNKFTGSMLHVSIHIKELHYLVIFIKEVYVFSI